MDASQMPKKALTNANRRVLCAVPEKYSCFSGHLTGCRR
jgi:hypothetical protein